MVPMTFIWWIYHFWARFWPYFNFVDFRAYFGPFSLVNRVQFSNADAGAWNSFLRLGIIFYGKLMHKDTKFCYSSFDISTFAVLPNWAWTACFSLSLLSRYRESWVTQVKSLPPKVRIRISQGTASPGCLGGVGRHGTSLTIGTSVGLTSGVRWLFIRIRFALTVIKSSF